MLKKNNNDLSYRIFKYLVSHFLERLDPDQPKNKVINIYYVNFTSNFMIDYITYGLDNYFIDKPVTKRFISVIDFETQKFISTKEFKDTSKTLYYNQKYNEFVFRNQTYIGIMRIDDFEIKRIFHYNVLESKPISDIILL
jgi:hypothetical protein